MKMWAKNKQGFTIVELLIVVVVIAILAAITIVAYNGINDRTRESAAKSAVQQAHKKIEADKVTRGSYATNLAQLGIASSGDTMYGYQLINGGSDACVWARVGTKTYSLQAGSAMVEGECGQVIASFYNAGSYANPILVRADAAIANTWGTGSPDSRVPSDNFWSRFEARIIPPVTGAYTFYTNTDDTAELIVDDQTVIPLTAAGVRDATSTVVNLTANTPVKIVYSAREVGGSAYATLYWSYGSVAKVIIPASNYLRP